MSVIALSPWDLAFVAVLVVALAVLAWWQRLGVHRVLLISAVRAAVQLTIIGFTLELLFAHAHLGWVLLMSVVMLSVAAREVRQRQSHRLRGWAGYGLGAAAMFASSFTLVLLALTLVVRPDPWYQPQYAIPLLGMLLGNTMNGVALSLERLTSGAKDKRQIIEARLMLGEPPAMATGELRRDALRSGLMPMINAMAAAGVVSLPGMMTGQILAGAPPSEAVKYQILIFFLIVVGTGLGAILAVRMGTGLLFDKRQRLRLDRLVVGER